MCGEESLIGLNYLTDKISTRLTSVTDGRTDWRYSVRLHTVRRAVKI